MAEQPTCLTPGLPIKTEQPYMAVSILFFARNGTRGNFFELFAKVFRIFRPRGIFFDGPFFFQNLADSAAIRLVQKSSKSEPSSPFFGRLKFRGKFVPCELLQNFLCGYKIEMAMFHHLLQPFQMHSNPSIPSCLLLFRACWFAPLRSVLPPSIVLPPPPVGRLFCFSVVLYREC